MKNVVGSIMSSLLVIAAIILAIMVFAPYVVNAQTTTTTTGTTKDSVCQGIGLTGGSSDCSDSGGGTIENLVKNIINVLSVIIGVVAVVMIMIGGFKYITSNGDSNSVNSAKNTILYAIVGLVIVAFAQVIVRFVINTSAKVQNQTYNHSLSVKDPVA